MSGATLHVGLKLGRRSACRFRKIETQRRIRGNTLDQKLIQFLDRILCQNPRGSRQHQNRRGAHADPGKSENCKRHRSLPITDRTLPCLIGVLHSGIPDPELQRIDITLFPRAMKRRLPRFKVTRCDRLAHTGHNILIVMQVMPG